MVARAENEHISLEKVWELLRNRFYPLYRARNEVFSVQSVSMLVGRRLSKDIVAVRNVPHFNASAVDGYALTSDETAGASSATPQIVGKNDFQWVNTGLAVDHSFDSVLMVEDSSEDDTGNLIVLKSLSAGENVRPVGEDVTRGQVIGRKGDIITPPFLALCVAAGIMEIEVCALPRTIYIPTGDEIVSQKEWVSTQNHKPGRVAESNSTMLKGYFKEWGLPFHVHDILPDDPELIRKTLKTAVNEYDLVLIGAGSAKGKKDHVASIITEEGSLIFHWLLMKPGRPAMGGVIEGTPVLDLPGFPMSTAVVLWSVVYPLLKLIEKGDFDKTVLAQAVSSFESYNMSLLSSHSSPPGLSEWLRFKAVEFDGQKKIIPLTSGSSTMWSMSETDGFCFLPAKTLECPKGTNVQVWITKHIPWDTRVLFQGSNDTALDRIVSYVRRYGGDIVLRSVGSMGGLAALSRGECHLAAAHLLDPESGTYNEPFIETLSGNECWERIFLYKRIQGIIVAKDNPKSIHSVVDLARPDIHIINRQPGAGTRVLLDFLLKQSNIDPVSISGYENQSVSHYDAANRIVAGVADAAIGIKAASDALGLDFIPITEEPFEIVIPSRYMEHPGIKAFLKALEDSEWKRTVDSLGGYLWPE